MSKTSAVILQNRIDRVIDIHRKDDEQMLNIEIMGVLEMVKLNIFLESQENLDEEDDT